MGTETKIQQTEDFIRSMKPRANFGAPFYQRRLERGLSLDARHLSLLPANGRSLIMERSGGLYERYFEQPKLAERIEDAISEAIIIGLSGAHLGSDSIGNPALAFSLAVEARAFLMRGEQQDEQISNALMELAQKVKDISKPQPPLKLAFSVAKPPVS